MTEWRPLSELFKSDRFLGFFEEIDVAMPVDISEHLMAALQAQISATYWQRTFAAQDDLLMNGTNDASDESLRWFNLERTQL